MKKTNNKYFFSSIVMVAILVALSCSCEKNTKVSEENKNEQFSEQEATDDSEANEDRLFFDDSMEYFGLDENKWEGTGYNPEGPNGVEGLTLQSYVVPDEIERLQRYVNYVDMPDNNMIPYVMTGYGVLHRRDNFSGGNLFAVLGFIEEGYFGEKSPRNVAYIMPEEMEKEYHKSILKCLQATFGEDRVRDLEVTIELNDTNSESANSEGFVKRKSVTLNIDGKWEKRLDEKGRPIITPDGFIERVYEPISPLVLRATELVIRDIINCNSARGDKVTIYNIPFNRAKQFANEDTTYLWKQKVKTTLLWLAGLIITCFICCLILCKRYYKKK